MTELKRETETQQQQIKLEIYTKHYHKEDSILISVIGPVYLGFTC